VSASPAARLVRMFAPVAGQPALLTGDRPVPTEPSRPTLVGRQPTPVSDERAAHVASAEYLQDTMRRNAYLRLNPDERLGYRLAMQRLRKRAEHLQDLADLVASR
jgi:hypothetical protein